MDEPTPDPANPPECDTCWAVWKMTNGKVRVCLWCEAERTGTAVEPVVAKKQNRGNRKQHVVSRASNQPGPGRQEAWKKKNRKR